MCVCLRYDSLWVKDYRENLERFFEQLRSVLPEECLVVWNLTMPLGKNIAGGFLVPEVSRLFVCHVDSSIRVQSTNESVKKQGSK